MHRVVYFLVLVGISCTVQAFDLAGRVLWNDICNDISALGQAKVILDEGKYSGIIRLDGSFLMPDVEPGSYILSVLSHDFSFDNLRIDIPTTDSLPEVRPYILGTPHSPPSVISAPYPITLTPRQKNIYFVERESFNLLGMLQNPMMLMMVGTGALMLGMPYLMKNIDPEIAHEVRERQVKMANIQSSVQNGDFRSGLSALLSTAEEESGSSAATIRKAAASSHSRGRPGVGSRGKRR